MKNKHLRKGRCLFILIIAFIIFNFVGHLPNAQADNSDYALMPIYVSAGDTLWSIVEENYDYTGDIRAAVSEIKKVNHLDSSELNAGDVIYIPVK